MQKWETKAPNFPIDVNFNPLPQFKIHGSSSPLVVTKGLRFKLQNSPQGGSSCQTEKSTNSVQVYFFCYIMLNSKNEPPRMN